MCIPVIPDDSSGSSPMGSYIWGQALGATGIPHLGEILSTVAASVEDWAAYPKIKKLKGITDKGRIVTLDAENLPPEMLAAYGYVYDENYGVLPIDYSDDSLGMPRAEKWVQGSDGTYRQQVVVSNVTGEVLNVGPWEIPPAVESLASSASMLAKGDDKKDERLADAGQVARGGTRFQETYSSMADFNARFAELSSDHDNIMSKTITMNGPDGSIVVQWWVDYTVESRSAGPPVGTYGTGGAYSRELAEEQARNYAAGFAQADAAQQAEYADSMAARDAARQARADQIMSRIGPTDTNNVGSGAPTGYGPDVSVGDWQWSVVAVNPARQGAVGDPVVPEADGQGRDMFGRQGFFNDGRVVPNIFKVIKQDLWAAADKTSGAEYALTYPFVMAMSGALLLPQGINDIPNIPTLFSKAFKEADEANWGNALEPAADTLGALGILGELAGGVSALSSAGGGAAEAAGAAESVAAEEAAVETGARRVLGGTDWEAADAAYDEIRASTTDVAAIAEKTGFSEADINLAKDHVFHAEHLLDDGIARFDADPYMANAWGRLVEGTFNENDLMLLRHEIYEANYEQAFNSTYREAHEAALAAGYVWKWEP